MTNLQETVWSTTEDLLFLYQSQKSTWLSWVYGGGYLPVDGNSAFPSAFPSSSLLFPGRSRAGLWHPWLFSWNLPLCFGWQQKSGKLDTPPHETTPKTQSQPLVPELSPPELSWVQTLKVRGEFGIFAKSTRSKGVGQHQRGGTWLTGLN